MRGMTEEDPEKQSRQRLILTSSPATRLRAPIIAEQLEQIRRHSAKISEHAGMLESFLQQYQNHSMVSYSLARSVLCLVEQGKYTGQYGSYDDNDATVEDLVSLLPNHKPTSRVIFTSLQSLIGMREDVAIIPPSLLRKWTSSNNDIDTRNQIGWYFRPCCHLKVPDPEVRRDVWETPVPKTVLVHLPHGKTASEVIAICTVMTSMCDVLLYGTGDQEVEIQKALKESKEQLNSMLSRVLANDAGK